MSIGYSVVASYTQQLECWCSPQLIHEQVFLALSCLAQLEVASVHTPTCNVIACCRRLMTAALPLLQCITGVNASDINYTAGRYFGSPEVAAKRLPFDAGFESVGAVAAMGPDVSGKLLLHFSVLPGLRAWVKAATSLLPQ